MQLKPNDLGLIVVGVSVLVLLGYIGYSRTDQTGQPRYESTQGEALTTGFNVLDTVIDRLDTGSHYFHPAYCVPGQTQIFTAHRYPTVSGGNVSTLIHHGMDAMSKKAPQDTDWFERPPGEVMW